MTNSELPVSARRRPMKTITVDRGDYTQTLFLCRDGTYRSFRAMRDWRTREYAKRS